MRARKRCRPPSGTLQAPNVAGRAEGGTDAPPAAAARDPVPRRGRPVRLVGGPRTAGPRRRAGGAASFSGCPAAGASLGHPTAVRRPGRRCAVAAQRELLDRRRASTPPGARLTGREVLTWRNTSTIATSELHFHLYYNAWRNTRSTWLREARRAGWVGASRAPRRGGLGLDRRHGDPAGRRRRRAAHRPHGRAAASSRPTTGTPDDRTVMAVPLPRAVAPGETRQRRARVDRAGAAHVRAHRRHRQLLLPRAVVPEDRRARGRRLELPPVPRRHRVLLGLRRLRRAADACRRGWVVGATGVERERARQRATAPRRTASTRRTCTTSPGRRAPTTSCARRASSTPGLPPVDMRLLLQPEHAGQADRHFAATRAALRYYGKWFGAVPLRRTSRSSIPPGRAAPAAWSTRRCSPAARAGSRRADVADPEGVTVHEAGHQFWYGIVGNNEFEDAWLDEGFNTFSTGPDDGAGVQRRTTQSERFFGGFIPWVLPRHPALARDGRERAGRATGRARSSTRSPRRRGATGRRPAARSPTARPRSGCTRSSGTSGWPTLQRILSTFFARWKFRHPKPAGLLRGRQRGERARHDLVLRPGLPQLERVRLRGADAARAAPVGGERLLRPRRHACRTRRSTRRPDRFRTTVVVRRLRRGRLPGRRAGHASRTASRCASAGTAAIAGSCSPTSAAVEGGVGAGRSGPRAAARRELHEQQPDARAAPPAAATKWTLKWMIWLQDLLLTYAFFV